MGYLLAGSRTEGPRLGIQAWAGFYIPRYPPSKQQPWVDDSFRAGDGGKGSSHSATAYGPSYRLMKQWAVAVCDCLAGVPGVFLGTGKSCKDGIFGLYVHVPAGDLARHYYCLDVVQYLYLPRYLPT